MHPLAGFIIKGQVSRDNKTYIFGNSYIAERNFSCRSHILSTSQRAHWHHIRLSQRITYNNAGFAASRNGQLQSTKDLRVEETIVTQSWLIHLANRVEQLCWCFTYSAKRRRRDIA